MTRADRWAALRERPWDLVVIGGGITGAGVLAEAARSGYRALLVEARDFAWGTSSRSSKMVHGGLRYLRQGQIAVTWHSVRQRERLLRQWPGLVRPLGFVLPLYRDAPVPGWLLNIGLVIYDAMAGRRTRRACGRAELDLLAPRLRPQGLTGGLLYQDAITDDAWLVLRVIADAEAVEAGRILALNYARVEGLARTRTGAVAGVVVRDAPSGEIAEVSARVVVNATGIWADGVRGWIGRRGRLRLLRGSHLVFPSWRLPVAQGITLFHPSDGRPVYVLPWEGVTVVGTTDLDLIGDVDQEPGITAVEAAYLLDVVRHYFPSLDLASGDVLATFSGVRPVVGTGRIDPSKESREHVVWVEDGLVTVTGGKLTTFGLLARDALRAAGLRPAIGTPQPATPQRPPKSPQRPPLASADLWRRADRLWGSADRYRLRLVGRYGAQVEALLAQADPDTLEPIPGTDTLWAELPWAAAEAVEHLDDLLLRRVRLGIQLPGGGMSLLDRIRPLVQPALGWDDARWQAEVARYQQLWERSYSPPAS